MIIFYKCTCCAEQQIDVPDRRKDTDILKWMELVTSCISFDHAELSPFCRKTTMEYAKIPADGEQIGTPLTRQ